MIPYKTYKIGPYHTSEIEIKDLLKAWIAISIAFAILLGGFANPLQFSIAVLFSGITAGLGFVLHEMAHKIVAQRYRCFAEFRANNMMLLVAVITSFFGIIFAAPGAVVILGHVGKKENGIISIAGIAMNILLAILFFALMFISPNDILRYGFMINAWLGLFNLIPLGNFDGTKVLMWNKIVYGIAVALSLALVFLSFQS